MGKRSNLAFLAALAAAPGALSASRRLAPDPSPRAEAPSSITTSASSTVIGDFVLRTINQGSPSVLLIRAPHTTAPHAINATVATHHNRAANHERRKRQRPPRGGSSGRR